MKMDDNNMKLITGAAIGALILVVVLMSANLVAGTIDETISGVDGHFTIMFSDQPMDGDTVTITYGSTTETYEYDTDGSITPGNIRVVPALH